MSARKVLGRTVMTLVAAFVCAASLAHGASEKAPAADPFEGYQELLDRYLTVVSTPGEPLVTRFDYLTVWRNPERFQLFQNIRAQLLATPPSKMTARDRRAWAINTYNLVVLETISNRVVNERIPTNAKKLGVKGYQLDNVRQIQIEGESMFGKPLIEVEGKTYTLDQFERTFVFDGFDPVKAKQPPKTLDPRAHFAVVCGAVSCPPLQPRAYRGDSLEIQLDNVTRDALRSPAHLLVRDDGRISVSQIFQWYGTDFGGPKKLKEFLVRYAPPEAKAKIQPRDPVPDLYLPWDWNLNQPPKPQLPLVPQTRGDTRSG